MPQRRKKILFLNHSASLTGAGILLLHLARWLKENTDLDIEVLSNGNGPLNDHFRQIYPTKVWRGRSYFLKAAPRRLAAVIRPKIETLHLKAFLGYKHYDLVYANSAATAHFVAVLEGCYKALLWHIHELPYVLEVLPGRPRLGQLFPKASRFIAVSQAVLKSISETFGVPTSRVDLIHEFVPLRDLASSERQNKRGRILAALGWPMDSFVIGGCGTPGWRKGTDLFVQIGREILNREGCENVYLLWVGGSDRVEDDTLAFDFDARLMGLGHHFSRVPTTPDVDDYYCAMDAFALTSREDPFPLVMLEAGMHRLPVVCFADSGGGPEYVADDAGFVARYLDVNGFANHLLRLRSTPTLRHELGEAGRAKVETRYTIKVQGPKLLESIEKCLQGCA